MNRETWKIYYRQVRIWKREQDKAIMDAMIYGTGFVRVDSEGFVNHVLPETIYINE